jgi:hypothetical protein
MKKDLILGSIFAIFFWCYVALCFWIMGKLAGAI